MQLNSLDAAVLPDGYAAARTQTPRCSPAAGVTAPSRTGMGSAPGADGEAVAFARAVDAVLHTAEPMVERIAALFIPAWPSPDVEVGDLVQDVLLEIVAALAVEWPPEGTLHPWVSRLAFRTLHQAWCVATEESDARRVAMLVTDWPRGAVAPSVSDELAAHSNRRHEWPETEATRPRVSRWPSPQTPEDRHAA